MTKDDLSDLSSLSSLSPPPPSESESEDGGTKGILKFFPKVSKDKMTTATKDPSPPPRKREPSPPHEITFADNPDIAFIVMFRNRFDEAFPRSAAALGPQELEDDITEPVPGSRAEGFLCATLGLLLNRKQDVKPGHYNRALEEAISTHRNQWPPQWEDKNPLSGGATFASKTPTERLTILRYLIYWALSSSEAVRAIVTKSYKQARREDDLNQPLSVQSWGSDSDKRRYFLIEGRDNTTFRVYRESNPAGFKRTWRSVADGIDSITALANKLENEDGGPKAKRLSHSIHRAIPRLQESEEKRRRREYRQRTRDRFKRPELGFSLYEGRTRGKRVKYTYSDEDDDVFSDYGVRRSARNTGTSTPAEQVTTMSGRQVRPPTRLNPNGDSAQGSVQGDTSDTASRHESTAGPNGRAARAAARSLGANGVSNQNGDSMEDDETSEPDYGDDEGDGDAFETSNDDEDDLDDDEALLDEDLDIQGDKSFVVKLAVNSSRLKGLAPGSLPSPVNDVKNADVPRDVDMADAPVEVKDAGSSIPIQPTQDPTAEAALEGNDHHRVPAAGTNATSLAYRGSPEKSQAGAPLASIDVQQ